MIKQEVMADISALSTLYEDIDAGRRLSYHEVKFRSMIHSKQNDETEFMQDFGKHSE